MKMPRGKWSRGVAIALIAVLVVVGVIAAVLHVPWLLIAVGALLVLAGLVAGLAKLAPAEFRNIGSALKSIGPILWLVWCWTYIIRWRLRFKLRHFIVESFLGVVLVASSYVFLQIALAAIEILGQLSDNALLKRILARLPDLPTLSFWVEGVLLAIALLLVRHHWNDWKLRKRESRIPEAMEQLILQLHGMLAAKSTTEQNGIAIRVETKVPEALNQPITDLYNMVATKSTTEQNGTVKPDDKVPDALEKVIRDLYDKADRATTEYEAAKVAVTDAEKRQGEARKAAAEKARETFLEEMMTRIKAVLEVASKRRIALSLMRLDGDDLVIKFVCPKYDKDLDSNLKLRLGQGGAGVAYRDGIPVYIPSTHHLVGINLKTSAPTGETYKAATEKKEDKKEAYRSLLCVPVFGGNGIVGVLNVSSSKRASFYPLDFKIAKLAAALVSIVS